MSGDKISPAAGCWALLFFFLFIHLLGMVVIYYAWNLGVVGMVAAAGGDFGLISFSTALGGSLAVSVIRRAVGGTSSPFVTKE